MNRSVPCRPRLWQAIHGGLRIKGSCKKMLRAFFDETGTNHKTETALVVGGFLGQAQEWQLAEEAWEQCLQKYPGPKYFSHRQCRDEAKLLALAGVVARFQLIGFCAYVRHTSLVGRDAKAMKGIAGSRPYDWAFLTAVEVVLEYVQRHYPDERVDFVFDHRNELRACIPAFRWRKITGINSIYRYAGQCESGDDKLLVPLQMADLLVGEFHKSRLARKPSKTLRILIKANDLVESVCLPPLAVNSVLALNKASAAIREECIGFLKEAKKINENDLPTDMATRFRQLLKKAADHEAERYNCVFDSEARFKS